MANITVRREDGNRPGQLGQLQSAWEPIRRMRELMGWDPFQEMMPFLAQTPSSFVPTFEVKETKESYVFKADVPGVKESDLEIMLTGNRLMISGRREQQKEEQNDRYFAYERSFGEFTRSFTLPEGIDEAGVNADLKDGVLTVSIRKKPEVQPKKITIKSASQKS
jgi:HSP20 family protein